MVARDGAPRGFELLGSDGVWRTARTRVAGLCARVHSAEIPSPLAVRYGGGQDPDCNLFDGAGFPAAPFVLAIEPRGP
ncbi:MAG TPA: hypothetical protein VMT18_08680 [Planctomycetota bacterium]|nr:hypothetical protein [Planctomycetota bacterium]